MFKDAIDLLVSSGDVPKFNKAIAEGVGFTQAKDGIHKRVHSILKRELVHSSDNPKLPEGLEYVGLRHMSPLETYVFSLKDDSNKKSRRRGVAISPSDKYMVALEFKVPGVGQSVWRQLFLPFIRRGGFMYSWGTLYHVAPVIHTPGIVREHGGLFINFDFTRKVTLQFCDRTVKILVNGREEQLFIPGSSTLYGGKGQGGAENGPKALPYWIFGKYGFTEGIKRMTGANVFIYPAHRVHELDLTKYVVIQSGERAHSREIQYVLVTDAATMPSSTRGGWTEDEHVLLVMCAAFFRAAHFYAGKRIGRRGGGRELAPLFTRLELESEAEDLANLDSADAWKEILGRSWLGNKPTDIDVLRSMETHFSECERYLTSQFRGELMITDPEIKPDIDFFEFLFYIVKLMTRTRLTRQRDISSMYGKRLTVTDYLLLGNNGFTATISKLRWRLEGLDKFSNNGERANLGKVITDQLNRNIIANLVQRSESSNGGISTFNASTESLVLAISTHAISQTETDVKKGGSGKTVNLSDKTKQVSASMAENGNVYYVPKSAPFKYNMLNTYMKTTPTLVMVPNPKLRPIISVIENDLAKIGN